MPDVFTAVMILAMYLLAFHAQFLSRIERVVVCGILFAATSAHLSHCLIASTLVVLAAVLCFVSRGRRMVTGLALTAAPVALSLIAFFAYNSVVLRRPMLSPAGSTFVLASMIEQGPARRYLEAACPDVGYRLCAYADRLPATANEFLWAENSVLRQVGGFEGLADESRAIVGEIIRREPLDVIQMIATNSARQLLTLRLGAELKQESNLAYVSALIATKFGPRASAQLTGSLQLHNRLPLHTMMVLGYAGLAVGLCAALYAIAIAGGYGIVKLWTSYLFLAGALVANATVCGGFSGVHDRYQARIAWLIPLFGLVGSVLAYERRRAGSKSY
jgi:hypothetical protein